MSKIVTILFVTMIFLASPKLFADVNWNNMTTMFQNSGNKSFPVLENIQASSVNAGAGINIAAGIKAVAGDGILLGGGVSSNFRPFYISGMDKKLIITDMNIENFNSTHGGVVVVDNSKVQIEDSGFINNSVSGYGGAIYVGNGSIVDIKANHANVVFSGNKSNFNGTFYDNTSSAIAVFDSVLNLSSYVDEDDYIIFKDSQNIFFNNASTINLNSAKLQFLNNEGINGDGVLNLDGTTTLTTTVDLANNKMPKIDAGSVTGNGDIQINKIILTSDASSEKTTIEFTSKIGRAHV